MSFVTAVTGKGGTGKTTVAGLFVRYLVHSSMRPVLAVDADPDANLPEALGFVSAEGLKTIGRTRQEFFDNKGDVPAGMPKEAYLELMLNQTLMESRDIDLLVMGRPEGPGCYCYINNILRKHLEVLAKNYPYVVIDNEAGLEHLSRRTARHIDSLVIVSDYSLNGLRAARRIRELAGEMKLDVRDIGLVVNDAPSEPSSEFMRQASIEGVRFLGIVPHDDLIPQYDIDQKTLLELPDEAPVCSAANAIAAKVFADEEHDTPQKRGAL
jgi:CO dehydrogenase maturation factor